MALVPILCPKCGANVSLEEGQTLVRCAYCHTSSYLPHPAVLPHRQQYSPPRAPPPAPPAAAPRSSSGKSMVVPLVAGLGVLLLGALGFAATYFSGGTLDYYDDAEPAKAILMGEFGDAEFVELTLMPKNMHVRVLQDGKIQAAHIRGREIATPSLSAVDDVEQLKPSLWRLSDVDFTVTRKIVEHARGRRQGKVSHLMLERSVPRQSRLSWRVGTDVDGKTETAYYDLTGTPLVESPFLFLTETPPDLEGYVRKGLSFEPKLVRVYVNDNQLRVDFVSREGQRDIDTVGFTADGLISLPTPTSSDNDPKELAAKVFSLAEVPWPQLGPIADRARQQLEITQGLSVDVRRWNAKEVSVHVYGSNKRGASRTAEFSADGKPL